MYDFVEKWSENPKVIKKIKEYMPSYLSQFKKDDREIICKLLSNVDYYTEENIQDIISEYSKFIMKELICIHERYKVCYPTTDSKVNHNTNKLMCFLDKRISIENNILSSLKEVECLIILDDYCGSGDTLIEFLSKVKPYIDKKINIYYYPIFITQYALNRLNSYIDELFTLIIKEYCLNKAYCLSLNNIFVLKEKQEFIRICEEKNIIGDNCFGYKHVEDKFVTRYFTPNNSLGILWYNERLYKPLFGRAGRDLKKSYKYLTNEQIMQFRSVIKHTKNIQKITYAKVGLLLYNSYTKEEIEEFLGILNVDKIISDLINQNIIKFEKEKFVFYKNLSFYYREKQLKYTIEFGDFYTKQEKIENSLRGII